MSFNAWGNGYVYWDGSAWPIGGMANNGEFVTGTSVNGIPVCVGLYGSPRRGFRLTSTPCY